MIISVLLSMFSICSFNFSTAFSAESSIAGKPAPDFTLLDLEGNEVSLSDFRGKIVILDFWATWCPPCIREIPHFIDLYKRYKNNGLAVIGISVDHQGINVVKAFNQRFKINYPILMADNQVTRAYGNIRSIPTTFVIDPEGKFYRMYVGYRGKDVFEKDIKKLLPDVKLDGSEIREYEVKPSKYVIELNQLGIDGRPEKNNAALNYQKAIELYVMRPEGLEVSTETLFKDLPEQQITMLKKWIQDNSRALEQLQIGSNKPFCWFEQTGGMLEVNPQLQEIKDLAFILHVRAKLKAEINNINSVINDIGTLYRFGTHISSGPSLTEEKMMGIAIKDLSLDAGFDILDRKLVSSNLLKKLEDTFKQSASNLNKALDIRGDKINMREKIETDPTHAFYKTYLNSALEYSDTIAAKTPWEIHTSNTIPASSANPLIEILSPAITRLIKIEYSSRVETQALLTTISILRYKTDKNNYPDSLSELKSAGYIEELPMDPFSDNPLVYKQTPKGFTLYSLADDYDDDGGQYSTWGSGEEGGDQVFWPVEKSS